MPCVIGPRPGKLCCVSVCPCLLLLCPVRVGVSVSTSVHLRTGVCICILSQKRNLCLPQVYIGWEAGNGVKFFPSLGLCLFRSSVLYPETKKLELGRGYNKEKR